MVGPECQLGAGRAAGPSSPEQPPCSQQCRSGTAEGHVTRVTRHVTGGSFLPSGCPPPPKGPEGNGACSGPRACRDHGLSRSRFRCAPLSAPLH